MAHIMTEEQKDYVEMVRNFMQNEVKPHVQEIDRTGDFPMELYRKAFELGLHTLEIPDEYGGAGLDFQTTAMMFEEMARVDCGFPQTLATTFVAFRNVMHAGTDEQKQMFADIILPGALAGFCVTEPNSGSDASSMRTTAVKDGNDYIINGVKNFITNGAYSDVYVVFAVTDKTKGTRGISAFIVPKGPGISTGKKEDKMGLRSSNTCDVIFDNVRVPAKNRIGEEGTGLHTALTALNISRAFVGAIAVGISQGAIDESVKYAKERVQFGKPIGQFQAVQMMLADMEIETEAARHFVMHSMRLIDAGQDVLREGAAVKCFAGDVVNRVTSNAVQIFGGYGYSREYPVEKMMRDAKIYQIFEGTNQIQRFTVAKSMLR